MMSSLRITDFRESEQHVNVAIRKNEVYSKFK